MADEVNATVGGEETGAEGVNTPDVNGESNEQGQQVAEKTYTQAEYEKALQSEADKRVQTALETAKAKWQKDYEANLKAERDEAARLAKLSAEDRAKEEFKKDKEAFEAERKKYGSERLEFECTKQLAGENLPISFAKMLTGADADTTKANIDAFKTEYNKAIEAAINEKLKSVPPKTGGGGNTETDPFLKGFEN